MVKKWCDEKILWRRDARLYEAGIREVLAIFKVN